MSGAKLQGEIVKKYLEKYPMMPSLTIAKLVYNENPKVFRGVENARNLIRYYRGRSGKKCRSELGTRDFLLPAPTKENPYSLPEFDSTNYTPYHVPADLHRGLIIADLHVPYTCKSALEIAIADAIKFGIDFIIILGDFLDCYHLSRFEKDPRVRQFRSEIDMGKHLLCVLRKQFPEAHIILIATTAMIEEGWTIEQMLAMGCQFSDKMIRKVYWKANAEKALAPTPPKILTEQNQAV